MNIQMYSIKKLDQSLRSDFRLPDDPYVSVEAQQVLKGLGVVFFRDEYHGKGVVLQPDDSNVLPIRERRGYTAYYHTAIVDDDDYEPNMWDDEVVDSEAPTIVDYVKNHGDTRSWLKFNEEVHLVSINDYEVRRSF